MKPQDPFDGGSRSDDSTLFSLRTLTERGAPPSRADAAPSGDGSGLIDLAALAAMSKSQPERPKLDVAPFVGVGLFEVPQSAPEPAPPPQPAPSRAPTKRTIALVAAAVAVVAAGSAIAIAAIHGRDSAQLPPVTALHTATLPEAPRPEPAASEPSPQVDAKPVETAAPPPSDPPRGPARRVPKQVGSGGAKTTSSKPAPPCDLMCQMQKSVGKSR
jgi:hypothetical protein